jgi:hypothetical protein
MFWRIGGLDIWWILFSGANGEPRLVGPSGVQIGGWGMQVVATLSDDLLEAVEI